MADDELSLNELEQVGTDYLIKLNNVVTAFENNDFQKVINLGDELLLNPALNDFQREKIAKMISSSKEALNLVHEEKGFNL